MTGSATHQEAQKSYERRGNWRAVVVTLVLTAGWVVLAGRLIQLQGAQRESHHHRVSRQSTFTENVPARPGEILDRNGNVLAMTVTRESLYAVPASIDDPEEFVWSVASAVDINADELLKKLQKHPDRQFVWVRRRLTEEEAEQMRRIALPPETWGFRREYLRQYPQGRFASHVLGMRDIDNNGHGGLEQSLNDHIRGEDGVRVLSRDARGTVVEVASARSRSPQHGRTVVTALDLMIQIRTEELLEELAAKWQPLGACAIVMEPRTGEILGMGSVPAFNPNRPATVPPDAWRNLAVSAVFEPGSTFKPFIVAWAMQHGRLTADENISCFSGAYRMGPRVLHDHHPYVKLSVEDVLVKSSNIGMARIGERLGIEELYRATAAFGFGRRTGIELPGELDGLVRPIDSWDQYSIGSIPMGQEVAVTPLQLIAAHAALAADGRLVRPRLLAEASDLTAHAAPLKAIETVDAPEAVESHIVDAETAQWIVRHPMKQVVERGTGKRARIQGMSIFGKTGTAQKMDPETGGYSNSRHICSFVCGAPAENPQLLVLVMVDEPTTPGLHYGGTVAAPTATSLLQYALQRLPRTTRRAQISPEHDLPPELPEDLPDGAGGW